jgi:transcription elongation factor GreA
MDVRKRIEEELRSIDRELRVDLPKEILRAREHGDLSENAEYKAAKERQHYLENKRAQLQGRLAALSLINLEKIPRDRVGYGSRVALYDYSMEQEIEYTLVSPEESDISKGLLSVQSPIGRSLLGKKPGEDVQISTPSGVKDYEIRSLQTIHDLED